METLAIQKQLKLSSKDAALSDKLRGGYYTPENVAAWLCKWAIQSPADCILEPSCGDGHFLVEAAKRLLDIGCTKQKAAAQISGIEIITTEAKKASLRLQVVTGKKAQSSLYNDDFFKWLGASDGSPLFDCIVGNPPFIRYQNFPEPSRSHAMRLMEKEGLRPNKLTNIWVPFVVGAVSRLAAGGRIAMVLPAELLQVSYSAQLRSYLVDRFKRIELFTCNEMIFKGAEQEVVLFLASDKLEEPSKSHVCRIEMNETQSLGDLVSSIPSQDKKGAVKTVNHDSEKWLKYFLTAREISFMRALRDGQMVVPLREHAEVDVGVVTGRNKFFVVSCATIQEFSLEKHVIGLVGRSAQLQGAILQAQDLEDFAEAGQGVFLLSIEPAVNGSLGKGAKRYIAFGEREQFHVGYKCSNRTPWYAVPSIWTPDCFFFRQIYDFPRVVLNKAGATSTDTIHRMRCKVNAKKLTENLYTHLLAASAEIEGRSYGGGVLELEPTEAERLMVPRKLADALPLGEVDRLVREGRLEDVLIANDKRVLIDAIGMTAKECLMLRGIWTKMRDRRMSRRRRV